jgi:hypothetical protein
MNIKVTIGKIQNSIADTERNPAGRIFWRKFGVNRPG